MHEAGKGANLWAGLEGVCKQNVLRACTMVFTPPSPPFAHDQAIRRGVCGPIHPGGVNQSVWTRGWFNLGETHRGAQRHRAHKRMQLLVAINIVHAQPERSGGAEGRRGGEL